MLTDLYIEALLVDEELADQVWSQWSQGEIDELKATWCWYLISLAGRSGRLYLQTGWIN